MYFSDFKCVFCGNIQRKWEIRQECRCPFFECMRDNGVDLVIDLANGKKKTIRLGAPMWHMGSFKEVICKCADELVIPPKYTELEAELIARAYK